MDSSLPAEVYVAISEFQNSFCAFLLSSFDPARRTRGWKGLPSCRPQTTTQAKTNVPFGKITIIVSRVLDVNTQDEGTTVIVIYIRLSFSTIHIHFNSANHQQCRGEASILSRHFYHSNTGNFILDAPCIERYNFLCDILVRGCRALCSSVTSLVRAHIG